MAAACQLRNVCTDVSYLTQLTSLTWLLRWSAALAELVHPPLPTVQRPDSGRRAGIISGVVDCVIVRMVVFLTGV